MLQTIHASASTLVLDLEEFERALAGDGVAARVLQDARVWGLVVAVIGACVLAALLVRRSRRDRNAHGPTWRLLARMLHLTHEQRRLLTRLNRSVKHVNPAPLVISEACFDRAVRRVHPTRVPEQVESLRSKLFN